MFLLVPVAIFLVRHFDARAVLVVGLSAFATASLLGTQLSHDWAGEDFIADCRPAVDRSGVHAAAGHYHRAVQFRSDAGHVLCRLYPDHAARRRRDRHCADGDLAARPRADPFQFPWAACRKRRRRCHARCSINWQIFSPAHGVSLAPARALGTLAALVQREANVLAYIDGFWLCFWLAIVALVRRQPDDPRAIGAVHARAVRRGQAVLRKCGAEPLGARPR